MFCGYFALIFVILINVSMENISVYTLNKIERCVCEYFNVDYDSAIIEKSRDRKSSEARHFIIAILHDEYNCSTNQLSKYYNFGNRHIKWICANVRNSCNIYKEYKKHYDILTTVLLDLDFA